MADSDGMPYIVGCGAVFTSYLDGDVLGTGKYPGKRPKQ